MAKKQKHYDKQGNEMFLVNKAEYEKMLDDMVYAAEMLTDIVIWEEDPSNPMNKGVLHYAGYVIEHLPAWMAKKLNRNPEYLSAMALKYKLSEGDEKTALLDEFLSIQAARREKYPDRF